jgi:hypothetical protein
MTVTFPASPAGTEHRLILARSFTVTSATGTGATVDVRNADEPVPGMHLITVRATSTAAPSLKLAYQGPLAEPPDSSIDAISASRIELNVDGFWMPYSARIVEPFTVSGRVTGIPQDWTVASTHPFARTPAGMRFAAGAPAWDLALLAAPKMREVTDGRLRFLAPDVDSPNARAFRAHGASALGWLDSLLGVSAYPRATVVVVRRPRDSGYARPGYVVVTETGAAQDSAGVAKFMAHELAHAWFSRADPRSEDYWLTESPAEYLALRYVERTLGVAERDRLLVSKRSLAGRAGSMLGRGRVSDKELYAKGPLLLFDLEQRIGRSSVDRVLREFAGSAVHTTTEFIATLARVAGDAEAGAFGTRLR